MRKSQIIRRIIDENIKVNDRVFLKDGSGLTSINNPDNNFYIILPYPKITNSDKKLKDIEAIVVEAGLTDFVCIGSHEWCWLQDIVIDINGAKFRTPSQCVYKRD